MMRESVNEGTSVTEASIPNTVVMIFCKNENKYRANTLAVETAVSVEFSHREGVSVKREQRDHERERVCL